MFRCSSLIFGCGESFSLRTTQAFRAFFFFCLSAVWSQIYRCIWDDKKKHFYCEIMLFPPLSNWICLSSVAQYPLACSHTKPTRHNVISSSPIPHNSKKKNILIWKEIWLKTAAESPVSLQATSLLVHMHISRTVSIVKILAVEYAHQTTVVCR